MLVSGRAGQAAAAGSDLVCPRTSVEMGRVGTVTRIIGQDDPSDLSLLDELVGFMTRERFVYRPK